MRLKSILYATAATMVMAACSNDNNFVEETAQAIQIQANISSSTRVSNGAFVKGDSIGLHVVSTATNGLTSGSNVKYTANDGSGNFSSTTPIYYMDKNAVNVSAYYPYAKTLNGNAVSVTRAAQTDYLFAKADGVAYNTAKLSLTFDHVMSQFTLTIKAGTGVPNLNALTSVTLKGLNSTGTFNTLTGALSSSTPADYALAAANLTTVEAGKSVTLLLFPTEATKTDIPVDVVYGGVTYSGTLTSANGLAAGKSYSYTLTITRTGLTVDSASITPWGSGSTGASDAIIQPETSNNNANS